VVGGEHRGAPRRRGHQLLRQRRRHVGQQRARRPQGAPLAGVGGGKGARVCAQRRLQVPCGPARHRKPHLTPTRPFQSPPPPPQQVLVSPPAAFDGAADPAAAWLEGLLPTLRDAARVRRVAAEAAAAAKAAKAAAVGGVWGGDGGPCPARRRGARSPEAAAGRGVTSRGAGWPDATPRSPPSRPGPPQERAALRDAALGVLRRQLRHVVFTEPEVPRAGEKVTVYYSPASTPLAGRGQVYLTAGFNRWGHLRKLGPAAMAPPGDGGSHHRVRAVVLGAGGGAGQGSFRGCSGAAPLAGAPARTPSRHSHPLNPPPRLTSPPTPPPPAQQATFMVPRDAHMLDFVVSDVPGGDGTYDNRGEGGRGAGRGAAARGGHGVRPDMLAALKPLSPSSRSRQLRGPRFKSPTPSPAPPPKQAAWTTTSPWRAASARAPSRSTWCTSQWRWRR
jgi:hypothetical protein